LSFDEALMWLLRKGEWKTTYLSKGLHLRVSKTPLLGNKKKSQSSGFLL
jgi:hypothetical protein